MRERSATLVADDGILCSTRKKEWRLYRSCFKSHNRGCGYGSGVVVLVLQDSWGVAKLRPRWFLSRSPMTTDTRWRRMIGCTKIPMSAWGTSHPKSHNIRTYKHEPKANTTKIPPMFNTKRSPFPSHDRQVEKMNTAEWERLTERRRELVTEWSDDNS